MLMYFVCRLSNKKYLSVELGTFLILSLTSSAFLCQLSTPFCKNVIYWLRLVLSPIKTRVSFFPVFHLSPPKLLSPTSCQNECYDGKQNSQERKYSVGRHLFFLPSFKKSDDVFQCLAFDITATLFYLFCTLVFSLLSW